VLDERIGDVGLIEIAMDEKYIYEHLLSRFFRHRLRALWPDVDVATVRQHLNAIKKICAGDAAAGPIARIVTE
jgi:Protein of unknown function (DUF3037)